MRNPCGSSDLCYLRFQNANTIKGIDERCQFNPKTNQIEWSMMNTDEDKSIIWNQVKHLLNNLNKTQDPVEIHSLSENILVNQQSTVIITGVAGSGKSTILSRPPFSHYEQVKIMTPNVWVNVVTALHNVDGKRCSIWSNCIEDIENTADDLSPECSRVQTCQQLETFLENVNTKLGGDSVIKLLLHKDDQSQKMIFIRIVLLYTKSTDSSSECMSHFTLNHKMLSLEKQVELGQQLSPIIDPFFKDKTPNSLSQHQWIRAFYFYLDYPTDPDPSTHFFHIITRKHKTGPKKTIAIWEYLFMCIIPEVASKLSHYCDTSTRNWGQDILFKLVLNKNDKGRFILGQVLRTHAYENNFKNMYDNLSTENKRQVLKVLFNDPYLTSHMNVEIGSRSFSSNGDLLIYFNYVTTTRIIVDGRSCSMWTNYVGKIRQTLTIEKFEQFLQFILDRLGEEYLKELVLHNDGDGQSIISREISQEEDSKVNAMLSLLSIPSQIQVLQKAYTTPGMIEQMLFNKGSNYWTTRYLKLNLVDGTAANIPDGFNILASYFLEKFNSEELKQFIQIVTSLNKVDGVFGVTTSKQPTAQQQSGRKRGKQQKAKN